MALRLEDVKGVAHLYHPPIDKIVAQCLVERHHPRANDQQVVDLPVVAWWSRKECPPEQFAAWEQEGVLPIDIGSEKYHGQAGSASEFVAGKFDLDLTAAERRLIQMINDNNSGPKGGYLKGFYGSMAWTIRELYEIPGYQAAEIMAALKFAVHIFLAEEDMPGNDEGTHNRMMLEYRDLVELTAKCNFAPFTPGRLLWDMVRLGRTHDETQEHVRFWMATYHQMKECLAMAEEAIDGYPSAHRFSVAPNVMGIAVKSDDRLLTKAFMRHCAVLIAQDSRGHAVVSARGMDLADLNRELARREPQAWHLLPTVALNGGPMYKDVPRTALDLNGLVHYVRKYPPTGTPEHRGRRVTK